MKIYLVGMPGCGKSTLGKKLAEQLKYEFIDMDQYIEQKACMFIDEIFDAYGEDFFRELEKNTLKEFLEKDNIVIATGGGVIKDKENKQLMEGKCIYLSTDLEELKKRLDQSEIIRPLLKTKSVEELYEERRELYDYFADIRVHNTNLEATIHAIMEELL